jgi:electron transfer flavoprotein beta subunit
MTDQLPFVINPFDAIALEEAVRIRESGLDTEVVAVGIGNDDYEEQLRSALALGADRALHVVCQQTIDSWNVATVLRQIVGREKPQLVLMGKQAVDDDCNQAGQFLAAQLEWPQATFASKLTLDGDSVRVDRETDQGIETVAAPLPAVVTVDLRLNEPRYASLPSIMRARKKAIERLELAALGVEIVPRLEVLAVRAENSSRQRVRLENLQQLVEHLQAATSAP